MRKQFSRAAAIVALTAGLVLVRPVLADEEFAPPKPGPEHERLKKMEGTWQASMKMNAEPGKPPLESKGTMTFKMECGGLWLSSHLVAELAGQKFEGKGLDGYDPGKKKFVMLWVDSMGTLPMIGEGTYDKDSNATTIFADYPGPDGKVVKHKMVSIQKDDDTIEWSLSIPDKDKKDVVMMSVVYKRKK
jgi:hypothetical protein